MIDDGVIKYDTSQFEKTDNIDQIEFSDLEKWRKKLFKLNLIGEYPIEKVGFGNLSIKRDYLKLHQTDNPQFIISGTQTGKFPDLNGEHYTRVVDYNLEKMLVKVMGPIMASSEALTHASVYEQNSEINVVLHIHNTPIWDGMLKEDYLATPKEIPYGTMEMALAVKELMKDSSSGIFAMAGHQDGVVSYGKTLEEAGKLILEVYEKFVGTPQATKHSILRG